MMLENGARTVILTGASSGFGRELALQAARAGYAVVAVARRRERLESLEREILKEGGLCAPLVLDVRRKDAPATIVNTTLARFGRIDVIVHAAGLAARGDISTQSEASNAEQFETHVLAPLAITHHALEHLALTRGQVYFIGSGVARLPVTGLGAYPPAKAAIRSAATIMRRELRPREISVTYVDPGAVATDFMQRAGMQGPPDSVLLAPAAVAAKILRGFQRRPATLSASLFQTAVVTLGSLFPAITGAVLDHLPGLVGTAPLPAPLQPQTNVLPETLPVTTVSTFEAALEPIRARMQKFALRESTVREALERNGHISLGEFAMRWAGMPNKHERALTGEVLLTLERAGFLESAGEDTWRVVRKP